MPMYAPSPLVDLEPLARALGVGRVLVKDESSRLGLPSFKMLGASWAVCRAVGALDPGGPAPETLDELRRLRPRLGAVTLVTATDGNHGRAVARMARLIGARARVVVPDVVDRTAASLIEQEGAEVVVVEAPYDDAVRLAARLASDDPAAVLVQDTAWPGYEEIPQWIVDGYSTMFREIASELVTRDVPPPGLVVVPVGVGSLAQAAVTSCRSGKGPAPSLLCVEPESAACVLASLRRGRRESVVTGRTIMAGLRCGTPSSLAWPYLLHGVDAAVAVSDDSVRRAVAELSRHGVPSGPSGAASLAALRTALSGRDADEHREQLGLTPASTIVLLSTEGTR